MTRNCTVARCGIILFYLFGIEENTLVATRKGSCQTSVRWYDDLGIWASSTWRRWEFYDSKASRNRANLALTVWCRRHHRASISAIHNENTNNKLTRSYMLYDTLWQIHDGQLHESQQRKQDGWYRARYTLKDCNVCKKNNVEDRSSHSTLAHLSDFCLRMTPRLFLNRYIWRDRSGSDCRFSSRHHESWDSNHLTHDRVSYGKPSVWTHQRYINYDIKLCFTRAFFFKYYSLIILDSVELSASTRVPSFLDHTLKISQDEDTVHIQ